MILKTHPNECLLSYYKKHESLPPTALIKIKPLNELLKVFPELRWEGFGGYVVEQHNAIQKSIQGKELTILVSSVLPHIREATVSILEVHVFPLTWPAEVFCVQGGPCEIQSLPK